MLIFRCRLDWAAARGFHPPVPIHAVTFDYGGTLDGEASHWLDRFVALYDEAGVDLPFERIKTAFYHADDVTYAEPRVPKMGLTELMDFHVAVQLDALGLRDPTLHRVLVDRFVARSRQALAHSRDILARLAPRLRLGVISNFYGNVGCILAETGIGALLTTVVDSTVVGVSKPDRRIFDRAVSELGTAASEVLHVGDSYERDVVAARAAGLQAAWLIGPRERDQRTREHDCRVTSLDELVALLEAENGEA
jgi:HAD superfamily hydrolase (TIGR01549 family)